MPGLTEVRYSKILTNVAIAYKNELYIQDIMFPKFPSKYDTGYYFEKGRESFRVPSTFRAPGSAAHEVDYSLQKHQYITQEHALKGKIPKKVQDNAVEPLKPVMDMTEDLTERMKLAKEKAVIDLLTDYTTTFASYNQQLATYNATTNPTYVFFDDYTNSDPFYVLSLIKKKVQLNCGRKPNKIMMSPDIEAVIANHPKTKSRFQYVKELNTDTLPDKILGMDLVRAEAINDTSNEGGTESNQWLMGNYIFIGYVEPRPSVWKASVGYCFEHKPLQVKQWYDQIIDSTWVQLSFDYTLAVVGARCGFVIYDVLENP